MMSTKNPPILLTDALFDLWSLSGINGKDNFAAGVVVVVSAGGTIVESVVGGFVVADSGGSRETSDAEIDVVAALACSPTDDRFVTAATRDDNDDDADAA